MTTSPLLSDLTSLTAEAAGAVAHLAAEAREALRALVSKDGRVSAGLVEQHQHAAHALSWLTTYSEALTQMDAWAASSTSTPPMPSRD